MIARETSEVPTMRAAHADAPLAARCGACASRYAQHAWRALPLVETLTPQTIAPLVVRWPAGVTIEIRRCSRCGGSIARAARGARDDEP
jgi:hypothetical protein